MEPVRSAARWIRRLIDRERRAVHVLRYRRSDEAFQPWPTTFENRYPDVFEAIADRLTGLESPRILSFGCADGAEVRALRAAVPKALITGIDINSRAIARARSRDRHPLTRYVVATRPPDGAVFDAILAMAVFRHGDLEANRPADCSRILPFRRFAAGVQSLDAALAPGGLLSIAHAHFAFADLPLSSRYTTEMCLADDHREPPIVYGPDNQRKAAPPCRGVLFRKIAY